jgi:formate dehydrogenase iron-sulfur subunit
MLAGGVRDLATYLARGGGEALEVARRSDPDRLILTIEESKLRGRGGAGFPAGKKWRAVRGQSGDPVVVANADEGDPGAFSDKALVEDDPFRLLEGIAIAARAVGAHEAYIYLRCEYPAAHRILAAALAESGAAKWLGDLEIRLISGRGSFVCGEESALLNALEGRRPFVRPRPPFPFEQGYGGRPTLVHNVETLAASVWIVRHGAAAYRHLGFGESGGTKLVSLNSLFRQPGLVEVPFGIPLREIVEQIGGGLASGTLWGLMVGGPLAGLLPPSALDTPFTYEDLAAIGGAVGHGGVIAFDAETRLPDLVAEAFRFGATESCGLCVPCHGGTAELQDAFARIQAGELTLSRIRWSELIAALAQASVCGHGRGLAEFARSLERHYSRELRACLV